MCGISGYLNLNKQNFKIDPNLLSKMQRAISHRGPDSSGVWTSDEFSVGFSHSRLSIVDLSSAGHQPMLDFDRTVVVSFNGEIYNHLELRKELELLGYRYFSKTDTETLIYAYKEWGIKFVDKLDGVFAIALFDLKKDQFYLIRDRIGVKPVYYSLKGGVFSFASEIKALWQLPWLDKQLKKESIYDYLTFMVTPAPHTVYKYIYKLEAGTYISVDSDKKVKFKKYYSPLTNTQFTKSDLSNEKYVLDKVEKLLINSIEKRMISDVPVGAFLSGGLDSSLNVALMSKFSNNIKTFTVAFSDGPENNELKWARKVAELFQTDHHEIIISEKDAFEFYKSMVYQLDEPLADPVCIPFHFVSKLAKDNGIKVVQVGEGADELFFGYPTYLSYKKFYDRYWKYSSKLSPQFFKDFIYKNANKIIPRKSNYLEIIRNWAQNRELFWSGAVSFNEYQKNSLFNREHLLDFEFDSFKYIKKELSGLTLNSDFVKKMIHLELKNRLPELLLMRADKMSMLNGVEARIPFLDYNLVEFMLNVPGKLKTKKQTTKYLLKKVAEKYLPKEIIYRKKVGFASPINKWMLGNGKYFGPYFSSLVDNELKTKSVFNNNIKNLRNIYDTHDHGFAVQKWTLQNLLALKNLNNEDINC